MFSFLFIESSNCANCEEADQGIPSESCEASREVFVEPLSGKKPSEVHRIKDINTDQLRKKDKKELEDLKARKGSSHSQEPSSSGQSAFKAAGKTKHLKGKTPGMHGRIT